MQYSFNKTSSKESLTLFFKIEDDFIMSPTHPMWEDFYDMMEAGDLDEMSEAEVLDALSEDDHASQWIQTTSDVDGRFVRNAYGSFLDGTRISEDIAGGVDKILGEYSEDPEYLTAISRFLEKASQNPSMIDADKLYRWMLAEGLTITSDGDFIGYKSVQSVSWDKVDDVFESVTLANGDTALPSEVLPQDKTIYRPSYSGGGITDGRTYNGYPPSYVGAVVEMPRDRVDADGRIECSVGLHVGTYGYASTYSGNNLQLVKVNPKDVVSVPDYDFTKLRACRYLVVAEGQQGKLDSRMYFDKQYAPVVADPVVEEVMKDEEKKSGFISDMVSKILGQIKKVVK